MVSFTFGLTSKVLLLSIFSSKREYLTRIHFSKVLPVVQYQHLALFFYSGGGFIFNTYQDSHEAKITVLQVGLCNQQLSIPTEWFMIVERESIKCSVYPVQMHCH